MRQWALPITLNFALASFGAAHGHGQAGDGGNGSADEHPHGFVGGVAGEEAVHVGAKGVRGLHAENDQDDAADEQGQWKGFVHIDLVFDGRY
jgi:hypothetical protein